MQADEKRLSSRRPGERIREVPKEMLYDQLGDRSKADSLLQPCQATPRLAERTPLETEVQRHQAAQHAGLSAPAMEATQPWSSASATLQL